MESQKSKKITVDVIIPIYYGLGYISRNIKSLLTQDLGDQIEMKIVVVNDSGDEVYHEELVKFIDLMGWKDDVVLLKHEENLGFIETCYTGIENSESDYKLIQNSDTFSLPDAIREMVETAESADDIAMVNPVTNNIPVIEVEIPQSLNVIDLRNKIRAYPTNEGDFIDIVTGVGFGLLIKDKYIKKYGFWDRIFGMGYGEDTDLHFRYVSNGLRVVLSKDAFVYHRGEGSFADRDVKTTKAREIFLERYEDLYNETVAEFNEKTILNDIRNGVNNNAGSMAGIIFLSETNSLSDSTHRQLHYLANSLLMSGVSSTVVYRDEVSENSFIDDRMYEPTLLSDFRIDVASGRQIVINDMSMFRDALELAFRSYAVSGELPGLIYLDHNNSLAEDDHHLFDRIITPQKQNRWLSYLDLNIFSNHNIKTRDAKVSQVMFSQDTDYEYMVKVAKQLNIESPRSMELFKYGEEELEEVFGGIKVKQYNWVDTQTFFNKLTPCKVFVDVREEPNLFDLLTAFSAGMISLTNSDLSEFEGVIKLSNGSVETLARQISEAIQAEHPVIDIEPLVKFSDVYETDKVKQLLTSGNEANKLKQEDHFDRFSKYLNKT